jgi:hypothetical protein
MRITDEPTAEDDRELLERTLGELREMDRDVVSELSTELTMGAAKLHPLHPEKAAAMLCAARLLYAVSHEVPKAAN